MDWAMFYGCNDQGPAPSSSQYAAFYANGFYNGQRVAEIRRGDGEGVLTALILLSRDSVRCMSYVFKKLAGNRQNASHRSRSRHLSFEFYRVARQSASTSVASVCLELAQRLKSHGLPPTSLAHGP